MADHDEGAAIGVQRRLQLADADQVEVVGRLVEQQQLRCGLGVEHADQGRPQPLATRQRRNGQVDVIAAKQELRQQMHAAGVGQARRERREALRDGALRVEQVQSLGQVGDPTVGALDVPCLRLQVAGDDAQQRRLAGTVGTGQRDPFRPADVEVDTVVLE